MTLSCRPFGPAATVVAVCLSLGLLASSAVAGSTVKSRQGTVASKSTKKTVAKRSYSPQASKARTTKLSRARVAARVRMVRETPIPRFKTDATGALVPDLHAAAAIIYNPETHEVLWEENSQDKRSIASITKVMTCLLYTSPSPRD